MLLGLPRYCVKYTVGHVHCLAWDEGGDDSTVPSACRVLCLRLPVLLGHSQRESGVQRRWKPEMGLRRPYRQWMMQQPDDSAILTLEHG